MRLDARDLESQGMTQEALDLQTEIDVMEANEKSTAEKQYMTDYAKKGNSF